MRRDLVKSYFKKSVHSSAFYHLAYVIDKSK